MKPITEENGNTMSRSMPILPEGEQVVNTEFGSFGFEAVIGQVYGGKVYTTSDTFGGGHDGNVAIQTDVDVFQEFWLRPLAEGKDRLLKLKNHDFRAADGQILMLMLAKAKSVCDEPLFLANLDSKDAVELLGEEAASKHVQDELVGPPQNGAMLILVATMLALPLFAWYKTSSTSVTLTTLIGAVAVVAVIASKIPFFNGAAANANNRSVVEKNFRATYASVRERLTETQGLRWATPSAPKAARLN